MSKDGRGWHGERNRHSLAARGIPTTLSREHLHAITKEGKLLIDDDSDLGKLANEMQDRNHEHYGDPDLAEVIEAIANVPEFGDPDMLYEARRLFRNLGDELVLNDKEHEEINGWKRRLDNLIEEYEDWKAEEAHWRDVEASRVIRQRKVLRGG